MELKKMGQIWSDINTRLKENELLNKKIVLEMANAKVNTSIKKLLNQESFVFCVVLFITSFVVGICSKYKDVYSILDILMWLCIFFSSVFILNTGYKINRLLKIDLSRKIKENTRYCNQYKMAIKYERIIGFVALFPIGCLIGVLALIQIGASLQNWISFFCIFLFSVLYNMQIYKTFFQKQIQSILQSMDELKEFKEE